MSEPLKPCPFCGGKAKIERSYTKQFVVGCHNKKCPTNACAFAMTRKDAIAAWNGRAP